MTDNDLEVLYKSSVALSHYAGLRAVWDAGYDTGANITVTSNTPDASSMISSNTTTDVADPNITTV